MPNPGAHPKAAAPCAVPASIKTTLASTKIANYKNRVQQDNIILVMPNLEAHQKVAVQGAVPASIKTTLDLASTKIANRTRSADWGSTFLAVRVSRLLELARLAAA